MDTDWERRWRRLDAEHWVGVLGSLQTSVLGVVTAWALLGGVFLGVGVGVLLALLPGAITALLGWMTSAWRREKPWSWVGWTVFSVLGVLGSLGQLLGGSRSWIDALALGLSALTMVLLVHPDCRVRLSRLAPSPPGPIEGSRVS